MISGFNNEQLSHVKLSTLNSLSGKMYSITGIIPLLQHGLCLYEFRKNVETPQYLHPKFTGPLYKLGCEMALHLCIWQWKPGKLACPASWVFGLKPSMQTFA